MWVVATFANSDMHQFQNFTTKAIMAMLNLDQNNKTRFHILRIIVWFLTNQTIYALQAFPVIFHFHAENRRTEDLDFDEIFVRRFVEWLILQKVPSPGKIWLFVELNPPWHGRNLISPAANIVQGRQFYQINLKEEKYQIPWNTNCFILF